MRSKVLSCTYLALPSAIIVATVNLMATSAWAEHDPSWLWGIHRLWVVWCCRERSQWQHCCTTVRRLSELPDCRMGCQTVGRWMSVVTEGSLSDQTLSEHYRNTVGTVRLSTVGLSDCRIVGLLPRPATPKSPSISMAVATRRPACDVLQDLVRVMRRCSALAGCLCEAV